MQNSTFAELGLSAKVLAAIEAAGYTSPTPIQAQAIPVAATGRDVLGIAQTGTGKTASFVLPMITRLEAGRARARMPRSLILAPTRELAAQVAQNFEKYGTNHKLSVALLIGGVSFEEQNAKLDRGVDVLIATPGRLIDHFQRGRVMLVGVEILVVDEADRMLDMGFIPDIEKICKLLPPKRQTLFFSATMPPEITRLVDQFMKEPTRVEVAPPATTAQTITQLFQFCENNEDWAKRDLLRSMIREQDVKNAIIFCNRKRDVAILFKSMQKHGFNAGELHGDMDQTSRTATLDAFRGGTIQYLVASDVAARGLDIPEVSHVFNFDMPWDADDYVHRIGRTGRAGKEGISASLVTADDLKVLGQIEKRAGATPTWIGEPPGPDAAENASRGRRGRGRGGRRGESSRDGGRGERRRGSASPAEATERGEERARPDRGEHNRSRRGRDRDHHREAPPHEPIENGPRHAHGEGEERRPHRHTRPERRDDARPPRHGDQPAQYEAREGTHRRTRDEGDERRPHRHPRPERNDEARPNGHAHEDRGARRGPARDEARPDREQPRMGAEARARPASTRPAQTAHPRGLGDNIPAFLRRPVRLGERSQS